MTDQVDTLTEQIMIEDSNALELLEEFRAETARTSKEIEDLGTAWRNSADGVKALGAAEGDVEVQTNGLAGAFAKAGTALQMAFGLGVYQIVNNVINLVKNGVQDGLDFAQAMFLINSAVGDMRASGVDVQFKDLSNIVTDLGPKLQVFSNLDLSKAVGQVAALGGQFGLTAQQVSDLTEFSSVAVERFGGDVAATATQIQTALLNMTNAQARRVYQLTGVEMSALDIYNKAVELGLDNGAKTYTQLVDNSKVIAGTAILEEHLVELRQNEEDYLNTAPGKVHALGTEWQNLWTGFGIAVTNIIPSLTEGINNMIVTLTTVTGFIQAIIDYENTATRNPIGMITGGMTWDQFVQDAQNRAAEAYKLYSNPSPSSIAGSPIGANGTPLGTGINEYGGVGTTPYGPSDETISALEKAAAATQKESDAAQKAADAIQKLADTAEKLKTSFEEAFTNGKDGTDKFKTSVDEMGSLLQGLGGEAGNVWEGFLEATGKISPAAVQQFVAIQLAFEHVKEMIASGLFSQQEITDWLVGAMNVAKTMIQGAGQQTGWLHQGTDVKGFSSGELYWNPETGGYSIGIPPATAPANSMQNYINQSSGNNAQINAEYGVQGQTSSDTAKMVADYATRTQAIVPLVNQIAKVGTADDNVITDTVKNTASFNTSIASRIKIVQDLANAVKAINQGNFDPNPGKDRWDPLQQKWVGLAAGGNFTVPSGYANDNFMVGLTSGEHVQVTPAGQTQPSGSVFNFEINNPVPKAAEDSISQEMLNMQYLGLAK